MNTNNEAQPTRSDAFSAAMSNNGDNTGLHSERSESSILSPWQKGQPLAFTFTGNSGEYFGIWVVNLLLTIVTLGFYYPWAKVRRMRYFYNHTYLDGFNFDYTATPRAILISRLIVIAFWSIWIVATGFFSLAYLIGLVIVMLLLPWLYTAAYRFRLRNSVYRNIRFRYTGKIKPMAGYMLLGVFPLMITFGLMGYWIKATEKDIKDHLPTASQQLLLTSKDQVAASSDAAGAEQLAEEDEADTAAYTDAETASVSEHDNEQYDTEPYKFPEGSALDKLDKHNKQQERVQEELGEKIVQQYEHYKSYMPFVGLVVLSFFLFSIWAHYLMWRYIYNNMAIGQLTTRLHVSFTRFFTQLYLPWFLMPIATALAYAVGFLVHVSVGVTVGVVLVVWLYYYARRNAFIFSWNHLYLGDSAFSAQVSVAKWAWVSISNIFIRMLMLVPVAEVRMARMKVEAIRLHLMHDPELLVARATTAQSALAEELADVLDIDIAL